LASALTALLLPYLIVFELKNHSKTVNIFQATTVGNIIL
jgi:hypothetical protein